MIRPTVTVKIPPRAGNLAILRTAVGGFAARQNLTLEQVDDLRMAVEEVSVQLLRQTTEDRITMDVIATPTGVEVQLHAVTADDKPVLEESSWSWMILQALADEIRVEREGGASTVILVKHRPAGVGAIEDDDGDRA